MRTVAIIQARMGSERLPGKVLAEVAGKPLLVHMVERLQRCTTLDDICVASPNGKDDVAIWVALEDRAKWHMWNGPENDVLGRVLATAKDVSADLIVELTADCPLLDPQVVDEAVRMFLAPRPFPWNFVSTSRDSFHWMPPETGYPRGQDVRVFKTNALAWVAQITDDPADREHVSLYFWEHRDHFLCGELPASKGLSDNVRLTVDTPADLELVRRIFEHFAPSNDFSLGDILRALDDHPEWRQINANVHQKEVR